MKFREAFDGHAAASWYEKNRLIGVGREYLCGASQGGVSFSAYWPHSAFFCPVCGEIWARKVFEYEFNYRPLSSSPWTCLTKNCDKHGGPGLFHLTDPKQIPSTCVEREFWRAIQSTTE